ncbi:hypothetical protein TWF696_001767 [Orbilia brochopaga]|uniref:Glucose-methanol-choline oxidoreductase N-terminal domain-containing protein n=1 Tax=Orbilia brochopaga TaxID=3140254 RepID=A0AAV9U7C9_9PEZI
MYISTIYLSILALFLNVGKEQGVLALPRPQSPPPPPTVGQAFANLQFDYIIIGGGTAGLVVANRLSAKPWIKVGVLEAGADGLDDPIIYTPGFVGQAVGTSYDWNFATTPQSELNNRPLSWSRGKVLGGSSAINFFVWMRGNQEDYDAWSSLGNPGWDWTSMLPYFKKPEDFHAPSPTDATNFKLDYVSGDHGTGGPIDTSYSIEYGGSHQYWHDTLNNLGVPRRDTFGGANWGVWTGLTSVDPSNRTRSYSASAYYRPFAGRPNLHVLCNAMVKKINIDYVNHKYVAKGVKFTHGGVDYDACAKHEVILSAGTVQSPQILELSGIGNPTILAAAGVTVKVNNPNVGEHVQDRIMSVLAYEIDSSVDNQDPLKDPVQLAAAQTEYDTLHTGLLTVVPTDFTYVPLRYFLTPENITDLAASVVGTDARTLNIKSKLTSANEDLGYMEFVFDPNLLFPVPIPTDPPPEQEVPKYGLMYQMLQYPFSTGSIHIPAGTPDSSVHPEIDPKYYQGNGEIDKAIMAAGQMFADEIARTSPLSSIIIKRVVPAEPPTGPSSFEEWLENLTDSTVSDWHPIGSCSMGGTNGAADGVVDHKLRVYGVKKLRVIDASIMPLQISSHLQGTVYAIAEKGADLVLADWWNTF